MCFSVGLSFSVACFVGQAEGEGVLWREREKGGTATIALEQLQRSWRRRQRMCTTLNRPLNHLTLTPHPHPPLTKQSKPFTINYCWFLLRKPAGSSNFSRIVFAQPPQKPPPSHPPNATSPFLGGWGNGVVGERRNGNILVFGGRKKEVDNTSVLVASCHPLKRRCHFWKLCRRSSTSGSSSGCIEWPARETALWCALRERDGVRGPAACP